MMKNFTYRMSALFLICSLMFTITSCSKDDDEESKTFSVLLRQTDHFIDMLDTVYDMYDAFGLKSTDTSDGKFTVTPVGRLIVVKKTTLASDITYVQIKDALQNHYKNKPKVKSVFLNNGGTVTIDCRN